MLTRLIILLNSDALTMCLLPEMDIPTYFYTQVVALPMVKRLALEKYIHRYEHFKQLNVYSEACARSSAIHVKIPAASLAGINENYRINLNDQYKKYVKQQRIDAGKNKVEAQVQKMRDEKCLGIIVCM